MTLSQSAPVAIGAEAAARLQSLEVIVTGSPDAIVSTGPDGVICDCNPAAERLFGWSRAELVGESASVLVPVALLDDVERLWERSRRGEQSFTVRTECRRRDGTTVAVALTLLSTTDRLGAQAAAGIYRDLSEQRPLDEHELAERVSHLRTLTDCARPVIATSGVDHAAASHARVDSSLALVREQLGMDVAWLSELTEEQQIFHALDGDYTRFGLRVGLRIPRDQSVCHQMLAGTVAELVADVRAEPALTHLAPVREGLLGTYVGVPVELADGRRWGTLCAVSAEPSTALGERDLDFLRVFAGLIGEQLQRERLQAAQMRMQSELAAVSALLATLAVHGHETVERSQAVVELSAAVALELGLDDREIDAVQQVALVHDLGTIAIPAAVLRRPGPLSDVEWQLIREHPAIGARVLATIPALAHLAKAVRAEHERVDGGGYPDGLAGTEIPIVARIVLACDAYHAMRSDRPHQAAIGHDAACAELRRCAGTQFDREVVSALLTVVGG